jgi:multidrug efflux pump subunit AcrA (membrane-fusion protein)
VTKRSVSWIAAFLGLAVLAAVGYFTSDRWLPMAKEFIEARAKLEDHHDELDHKALVLDHIKLSPQAQQNLKLSSKPLQPDTYWRTIELPGTIVDRPGQSDRGVVSPVTGVVTKVHRYPSDTVKPGEVLFTVRLLSEAIHQTQSELYKTQREIQIAKEQRERLTAAAVPEARILEIDYQSRRLNVLVQAYRQELLTRGLTPEQIDSVAEGKFVTEVQVKAPQHQPEPLLVAGPPAPSRSGMDEKPQALEVQELRVELGQPVQAGQVLCLISNHEALYIEGRAFRTETAVIERAAREAWPVEVEFMEEPDSGWPPIDHAFTIRHIANTIDPASRTFAFYLELANESRSYEKDGRQMLLWRFRPGQRLRLHVRVEKLENVFVLPADAVVRDGSETYVFRHNGDQFDRKPVRVLFQDRQHAIIANDGAVPAGIYVAQRGAKQLNRALKAQNAGPAGMHIHPDGSVHSDH